MIWCYIIIAILIGIIAGFGYYEVTKSELKLNYETQDIVPMLKNARKKAFLISVTVGVVWPLSLVVLAALLVLVSMNPKSFDYPFDEAANLTAVKPMDIDLTKHNIMVLDEVDETDEIPDDTVTWADLNDEDEAESNNIKTTESE